MNTTIVREVVENLTVNEVEDLLTLSKKVEPINKRIEAISAKIDELLDERRSLYAERNRLTAVAEL